MSKRTIILVALIAIVISFVIGQNSIVRVVWPVAVVVIGGCAIHTLNARLFPARTDLMCRER